MIRQRAGGRCEYCRVDERFGRLKFQIEHIIARQHGGADIAENLALACGHCNLHKGPNLSGIDPLTGMIVELFHPRQEVWTEHFNWDGAIVVGLTSSGRATVDVLAMNRALQVAMRKALLDEGIMQSPN